MLSVAKTLDKAFRAISEAQATCALIGGMAMGAHGIQRSTIDVDFLIRRSDYDAVKRALLAAGFVCKDEGEDTVHFGGTGPLDLLLAHRPASLAMLERAAPMARDMPVVDVEDLIGLKIQAMFNDSRRRAREEADIQAIMERYGDKLDWDAVPGLATDTQKSSEKTKPSRDFDQPLNFDEYLAFVDEMLELFPPKEKRPGYWSDQDQ